MGLSCKVIRDYEGNPVSVRDSEGNADPLFNRLLETTDNPQLAMLLWATDQYYKLGGSFKKILKKLGLRYVSKDLNLEQKKAVHNVLKSTDYDTMNELAEAARKYLVTSNGVEVTRQSLRNLGLHTESEIDYLEANEDASKDFIDTITKLITTVTGDRLMFMSAYKVEFPLEKGTINSLGKPDIVDAKAELYKYRGDLVNLHSEDALERALFELEDNSLYIHYHKYPKFKEYVKDKYLGVREVQVLNEDNFEEESFKGQLRFRNTGRILNSYRAILNEMEELTPNEWSKNRGEIKEAIIDMVKEAGKVNIDVVGLEELEMTQEETISVLRDIEDLIYAVKRRDIDDISNGYEQIKDFVNDNNKVYTNKKGNIVAMSVKDANNTDLRKEGLVRVSQNLYRRFDVSKTMDELLTELSKVYESKFKNTDLIYPLDDHKSKKFKETVIKNLKSNYSIKDDLDLKIALYREVFNVPKYGSEIRPYSLIGYKDSYIYEQLPIHLKRALIESKIGDPYLYDNFYSLLDINKLGIFSDWVFDYESLEQLGVARGVLEDLKDYSILTGNLQFRLRGEAYTKNRDKVVDEQTHYYNNFELLEPYGGLHRNLKNHTVVPLNTSNQLSLGGELLVKVEDQGGQSIYQRLEPNRTGVSRLLPKTTTLENVPEFYKSKSAPKEVHLSKEESNKVENKINECK